MIHSLEARLTYRQQCPTADGVNTRKSAVYDNERFRVYSPRSLYSLLEALFPSLSLSGFFLRFHLAICYLPFSGHTITRGSGKGPYSRFMPQKVCSNILALQSSPSSPLLVVRFISLCDQWHSIDIGIIINRRRRQRFPGTVRQFTTCLIMEGAIHVPAVQ